MGCWLRLVRRVIRRLRHGGHELLEEECPWERIHLYPKDNIEWLKSAVKPGVDNSLTLGCFCGEAVSSWDTGREGEGSGHSNQFNYNQRTSDTRKLFSPKERQRRIQIFVGGDNHYRYNRRKREVISTHKKSSHKVKVSQWIMGNLLMTSSLTSVASQGVKVSIPL